MPTRPFYVQRNGDCIPLEGAWRVRQIEGDWWALRPDEIGGILEPDLNAKSRPARHFVLASDRPRPQARET